MRLLSGLVLSAVVACHLFNLALGLAFRRIEAALRDVDIAYADPAGRRPAANAP